MTIARSRYLPLVPDRHGRPIMAGQAGHPRPRQCHNGWPGHARPAPLKAEGDEEPPMTGTIPNRIDIDPITVEVIGSALASIVEEMGEALIRASYSTNIKERRDCSTALFDLHGNTLCQAEHIPMHLGSFIGLIPHIMQRHPIERDAARRRVRRQRRL